MQVHIDRIYASLAHGPQLPRKLRRADCGHNNEEIPPFKLRINLWGYTLACFLELLNAIVRPKPVTMQCRPLGRNSAVRRRLPNIKNLNFCLTYIICVSIMNSYAAQRRISLQGYALFVERSRSIFRAEQGWINQKNPQTDSSRTPLSSDEKSASPLAFVELWML